AGAVRRCDRQRGAHARSAAADAVAPAPRRRTRRVERAGVEQALVPAEGGPLARRARTAQRPALRPRARDGGVQPACETFARGHPELVASLGQVDEAFRDGTGDDAPRAHPAERARADAERAPRRGSPGATRTDAARSPRGAPVDVAAWTRRARQGHGG